jgi:hypothetical protein
MNNRNQTSVMNLQGMERNEIKAICPVAYQTKASNAVSENYTFIPTSKIIDDMDALGWKVGQATMVRSRKNSGFQKHLIKFFNPSIEINGDDGTMYPQVLLTNSHDGKSSFKFEAGIFRLVCSNGLVIKSHDFGSFNIRHMGYSFDQLQTNIKQFVDGLPSIVERMNMFITKTMTENEMKAFAQQAIDARFGGAKVTGIELEELLAVERNEDNGNTLWKVFNRVQEKIVGGSFTYVNEEGKLRKARPIKNFQQDMALNGQLWEIAEQFVAA